MRRALHVLFIGLLLAPAVSYAQSSCKTPSADCVVVGEWDVSVSLGLGERSNPIASSSSIPLVVIPQISYYGRRVFLDNLELGYTLYENDAHIVNVLATPGYDRVFFVRDDLQNYFVPGAAGSVSAPTPELQEAVDRPRQTTYFAGIEWIFNTESITGQLDALYEATGRHKGYELRGALAVPLTRSRNSFVLSGGFTWKSAATVDYYYGVDGYYSPGAAFNPFIKLGYARALSDRWSINAFAHYEYLDDAIASSPIVTDHAVTTVFAGVIFKVL